MRLCSDSNSDITSALAIAKSGENLVSNRNVDFSRNLGCALADFYSHYSPRDLQLESTILACSRMAAELQLRHQPSTFGEGQRPSHPKITGPGTTCTYMYILLYGTTSRSPTGGGNSTGRSQLPRDARFDGSAPPPLEAPQLVLGTARYLRALARSDSRLQP